MQPFSADQVVALLRGVAARVAGARADLGALDGAIGDSDHGTSMAEGFAAVVRETAEAAGRGTAAGDLFPIAARAFLDAVGATTGPLYASAFLRAGQRFHGQTTLAAEDLPLIVAAFAEGIAERGKARAGDKTMMDVWGPAARAVEKSHAAGESPLPTMAAALRAAEEGRDATRAMIAAVGRAARLGERTLGHLDPGAVSATLIIAALHDGLAEHLARGTA